MHQFLMIKEKVQKNFEFTERIARKWQDILISRSQPGIEKVEYDLTPYGISNNE